MAALKRQQAATVGINYAGALRSLVSTPPVCNGGEAERGSKKMLAIKKSEMLWDLQDGMVFFGCSERTLRDLIKLGKVPVVRIPGLRRILFRRESLIELAAYFEVPAMPAVKEEVSR